MSSGFLLHSCLRFQSGQFKNVGTVCLSTETSTKCIWDFNSLKQLGSTNYLQISMYQMLLECSVMLLIVKLYICMYVLTVKGIYEQNSETAQIELKNIRTGGGGDLKMGKNGWNFESRDNEGSRGAHDERVEASHTIQSHLGQQICQCSVCHQYICLRVELDKTAG